MSSRELKELNRRALIALAILAAAIILIIAILAMRSAAMAKTTEAAPAREGLSFDDMLDAIEWVESKGIETAVGEDGEVGAYQIKDIYLKDYVRITGDDWFVDYNKDMRLEKWFSRKVTAAVTKHYAHTTWPELDINDPQFIETAARTHKNPTERNRPSTYAYGQRILARMEAMRDE